MTAIIDPRVQIADAVEFARNARHHSDCRCGMYKRHWCTDREALWCRAIDDHLIDACLSDLPATIEM